MLKITTQEPLWWYLLTGQSKTVQQNNTVRNAIHLWATMPLVITQNADFGVYQIPLLFMQECSAQFDTEANEL